MDVANILEHALFSLLPLFKIGHRDVQPGAQRVLAIDQKRAVDPTAVTRIIEMRTAAAILPAMELLNARLSHKTLHPVKG